ncbi:MAG: hypothetical protein EOM83_10380 [Clostridia bacterium]|nr:hypothetical protein [Clostridia bacterium]
MKIKWRKWNRAIHRDVGYFFFAMSLIYGLSGIALNHIGDWNPNYIITRKMMDVGHPLDQEITREQVLDLLKPYGEADNYKKHFMPNPSYLKVFLNGGSLLIDIDTGEGEIEKISRRPIFHAVNYLHYNPKKWWTWFSDAFAGAMIVLATTGLFILRGRNGITRRGAIITVAGIIVPIVFLLLYY